jgi:hypothetical protein
MEENRTLPEGESEGSRECLLDCETLAHANQSEC